MEQAIRIREDDNRFDARELAADEVIDAFDDVLQALDRIIALTETAFPARFETPQR